jgi:hypothetical protein
MIQGKDYDYRDFLGAFSALDNRIIDTEERIEDTVRSVRRLDRKLKEDTGKGIKDLEGGSTERQVFKGHRDHYRRKFDEKGLKRFLPDFDL